VNTVSVLVVDDDYYARDAMQSLVLKDSRTHLWAAVPSSADAAGKLEASSPRLLPSLLLLDVRLGPDERGGIEAIAPLKALAPDAKVLMTSVSQDEDTILDAIRAGADGYVWKNETAEKLVNAIAGVCEGRFVVTTSVAEQILGKTDELSSYATDILRADRTQQDLTEAVRKTVYLYCFCGMSAKEIAAELTVSVNTVNSRIKMAYAILDAGSRQEAFQRLVEGPQT
jgi:DNA-binding NarL/FixJ family response regulator